MRVQARARPTFSGGLATRGRARGARSIWTTTRSARARSESLRARRVRARSLLARAPFPDEYQTRRRARARRRCESGGRRGTATLTRARSCLLYTSDAADDM
eukprot:3837195-Prymnesium_polylepis.1